VESVESENRGFDLIARKRHPEDPKTFTHVRFVEVKGRGYTGEVALTYNEFKTAERLKQDYWLYVVFHCASPKPSLNILRDPARLHWQPIVKIEHYRLTWRTPATLRSRKINPPMIKVRLAAPTDHPPMSRLTLKWFQLEQKPGQDLCLKIPVCDIYHPVIDRAFPGLKHIGWRPDSKGTCYTFFKDCSRAQQASLEEFLGLLKDLLLLTPSTHLKPHFQGELVEAYALDFNFQPDVQPLAYTAAGDLEHRAKDLRDPAAIEALAQRLAAAIRRHPTLARADFIAAMPPRPSSRFHLPVVLVERIGALLNRLVGLRLTKAEHPKLRDLPFPEKLRVLNGAFALEESVQDKTVLVIDDLYQSGVTAWSLARFLKAQGAREVYALACVKSWRDTDNQ
jgi:hypothetical protein